MNWIKNFSTIFIEKQIEFSKVLYSISTEVFILFAGKVKI